MRGAKRVTLEIKPMPTTHRTAMRSSTPHNTPRSSTVQHNPTPSARATSEREHTQQDPSKQMQRKDPAEAIRESAEAQGLPPQVGISSSELNSANPETKAQATEEAKLLSTNTNPEEGVSKKENEATQKKLEKEHDVKSSGG